jgi:nitrile hydratase
MNDQDRVVFRTAPVEDRVNAIQTALDAKGLKASEAIEELGHKAQEEGVPRNGARIVARAWIDPDFRKRLLANGREAAMEMGFAMPKHHRHLVVLENTPKVQNVICCTLCSCTAFTLIGLPPDWYKDLQYRSRVVRESRTVLKEMGLELASDVEVRIWDTRGRATWFAGQPPRRAGRKSNWPRS